MSTQDEKIEKRLHELRLMAEEYAKAQGERIYLEHFVKSQLAILQKEYQGMGFDAVASQEREARADARFLQTLDGLRAATERSESLRWKLRIAEHGIDIFRTREASRRAEMRGYGL